MKTRTLIHVPLQVNLICSFLCLQKCLQINRQTDRQTNQPPKPPTTGSALLKGRLTRHFVFRTTKCSTLQSNTTNICLHFTARRACLEVITAVLQTIRSSAMRCRATERVVLDVSNDPKPFIPRVNQASKMTENTSTMHSEHIYCAGTVVITVTAPLASCCRLSRYMFRPKPENRLRNQVGLQGGWRYTESVVCDHLSVEAPLGATDTQGDRKKGNSWGYLGEGVFVCVCWQHCQFCETVCTASLNMRTGWHR